MQRMAQHADVVINVEQVARYLGLSVGAVRKRCQRAQLQFYRNSKRLYFSKMEIKLKPSYEKKEEEFV